MAYGTSYGFDILVCLLLSTFDMHQISQNLDEVMI